MIPRKSSRLLSRFSDLTGNLFQASSRRPKPLISSSDDDEDFVKSTPQQDKAKKRSRKASGEEKAKKSTKAEAPSAAMKAVDAKDFFAQGN